MCRFYVFITVHVVLNTDVGGSMSGGDVSSYTSTRGTYLYTASGSNIVIICIQLIALHLIDKLPHYRNIAKLI